MVSSGASVPLLGEIRFGSEVPEDRSVRWADMARAWQTLFPRFEDDSTEEAYAEHRNKSLVASLRSVCIVSAVVVGIYTISTDWRRLDAVDLFWVFFYPGTLVLLGAAAYLVPKVYGGVPRHFDIWLTVLLGIPNLVVISFSSERFAWLLGVRNSSHGGEVSCVCILSIMLAAATHIMKLSLASKFLMVHAVPSAYLMAVLLHPGAEIESKQYFISGLIYTQGLFCYLGAWTADLELRKTWFLNRRSLAAVRQLQHEEDADAAWQDENFGSMRELAARSLERVSVMLTELLEPGVIQDIHLAEVFAACHSQVLSCQALLWRWRDNPGAILRKMKTMSPMYLASFDMYQYMQMKAPDSGPFLHSSDSGAELARKAPQDLIASVIPSDRRLSQQLSGSICRDDQETMQLLAEIGRDFNFDALTLEKRSAGQSLLLSGMALLNESIEIGLLKKQETAAFLTTLAATYKANPYHNASHAATVASAFMTMLSMCERVRSAPLGPEHRDSADVLNRLASMIAALGHDVGHPGFNNDYLINTLDTLAITYNDTSILENYHAAITFGLLIRPNAQIFSNPDRAEFAAFREHVVSLILATDMKKHFDSLADFRLRLIDPDFALNPDYVPEFGSMSRSSSRKSTKKSRPSSRASTVNSSAVASTPMPDSCTPKDVKQVQTMLMKAADIGHSANSWGLHVEWSKRIQDEFHRQGDEELRKGLPLGPCNKREGFNFPASQCGFLTFVAIPLWTEIARLDEPMHGGTGFRELYDSCTANMKEWERQKKAGEQKEEMQSLPPTATRPLR